MQNLENITPQEAEMLRYAEVLAALDALVEPHLDGTLPSWDLVAALAELMAEIDRLESEAPD